MKWKGGEMILGISGMAGVGKTTAALYLETTYANPAKVLPMANLLRKEVEDFLFGVGSGNMAFLLYGTQEEKLAPFGIFEEMARELCPAWQDFIEKNIEMQTAEFETFVTARSILQWWGTEYRRAQDPDYWVKAWAREAMKWQGKGKTILVDDVRFPNELAKIRSLGGMVVRIVRPGHEGVNNHESERALDGVDDWDAVVVNDGTLPEFYVKLNDVYLSLLDKKGAA